jgi:hypothetical protein
MRLFTHLSLFAFGILLVTLTVPSHADAPQAGLAFFQSVAQGLAVQPAPQIPSTAEGTCQASEETSNPEPFAPNFVVGLCGAACREECRDECWQMGRGCKPDCDPFICECFCNC